jgi:hypothetical protein
MPAAPTPGPVRVVEGYGLGDAPADGTALPWATVEEWLVASRNYWVCTVRPDGRPHAMPVWGLWVDGELWFSTDPESIKGRNLEARPDVVVHLESGDEVCVLEGKAERCRDPQQLATFDERYEPKYDVRPSSMGESAGVFVLRPQVALVWTEADFPTTATRFTFV